jgi:DNA (cytosine-5)-methyltransferase 1
MRGAYYNEIDPYAAQWLRNLIAAGHIAPGDVDERSIADVQPSDLKGYVQCHFFAGIGGWSFAARLAGWPDDRPLWTGSCPCQPFSVAGAGKGQADERHLWPIFFDLIRAVNPAVVMGEQVAAAVGKHWLDGVHSDLEGIGYAVGAAVVPACAVDAPHRRDRLWFVADATYERIDGARTAGPLRRHEHTNSSSLMAYADSERSLAREPTAQDARHWDSTIAAGGAVGDTDNQGRHELRHAGMGGAAGGEVPPRTSAAGASGRSHWSNGQATAGRRIEPSIRLLAHGVPARVGKLRAYGNAIVPQVAAEVIGAYLDAERIAA